MASSAASLAAARSLNVATPLSSVAGKTTSDRVLFFSTFFHFSQIVEILLCHVFSRLPKDKVRFSLRLRPRLPLPFVLTPSGFYGVFMRLIRLG